MHVSSSRWLIPFAAALAAAGCTRAVAPPSPVREPDWLASDSLESLDSLASIASRERTAAHLAPDAPLTRAEARWVEATLARLTLRERVAQMLTMWVLGDYTNTDDPTFREAREWVTRDKVGGILMSLGSPIEVAAKINALQRLADVPLLVSSDLEPGLGRLEGGYFLPSLMFAGSATVLPSNMAIAATGSESLAVAAGEIAGQEARAVGIELAFAPTADVNSNPANPVINVRSFGENPEQVGILASAFARGLQRRGVAATAKHFPGHGDTDTDSHLALPVVRSDRARLDAVELVPFRRLVAAGIAGVMTGHIALPAVDGDSTPATLSPVIVGALLRDTLGFRGLVVTDALSMEGVGAGYSVERSAVLAVQAGADLLVKPTSAARAIDAVVAAVERGDITPARIERSVRAILELKAKTGVARNRYADLDRLRQVVGSPAHRDIAERIAGDAITLLADRDSLVPASRKGSALVVIYAADAEAAAGRAFAAGVQGLLGTVQLVRIGPRTSSSELEGISMLARNSDRVIVATYVRAIEGVGRVAVAEPVAAWIDSLARVAKVIVVAHGNPYVWRQFPRVGSYLVTYGIGAALDRAAAEAVAGTAPIVGRSPVSLPDLFVRGDGLRREVVR